MRSEDRDQAVSNREGPTSKLSSDLDAADEEDLDPGPVTPMELVRTIGRILRSIFTFH